MFLHEFVNVFLGETIYLIFVLIRFKKFVQELGRFGKSGFGVGKIAVIVVECGGCARRDKGGLDVRGGSLWWRIISVKVGRRLCLLMLLFVVVWEGNPLCGTEAIRLLRFIVLVDK